MAAAQGSPVQTSCSTPSLLLMPPEILFNIFSFLEFSYKYEHNEIVQIGDKHKVQPWRDCSVQVLRSCQHLHQLGTIFLYDSATFLSSTHEDDSIILPGLPPSTLAVIQHLRLRGYPPIEQIRLFPALRTLDLDFSCGPRSSLYLNLPQTSDVAKKIVLHLLKYTQDADYFSQITQTLPNTRIQICVYGSYQLLHAPQATVPFAEVVTAAQTFQNASRAEKKAWRASKGTVQNEFSRYKAEKAREERKARRDLERQKEMEDAAKAS